MNFLNIFKIFDKRNIILQSPPSIRMKFTAQDLQFGWRAYMGGHTQTPRVGGERGRQMGVGYKMVCKFADICRLWVFSAHRWGGGVLF